MKNAAHIIKRLLYASLFVLLIISYLQAKFPFTELAPLEGYMPTHSSPSLTVSSWMNGSFQEQAEKYVNQEVGFRPVFMRIRNQLMYSLFNETPTREIVIGKEQFLYEKNYITAYLGRDFIGKKSVERQVFRLKKLQDTLQASGIHLCVLLAAGKASFFPEYIPERFNPKNKSLSNYAYYLRKFRESGVHFIDLNHWFVSMKDTSAYPLYPKYGIHWSKYGEALVADSMVHYIEQVKDMSLPRFVWDRPELSDTAREADYDMAGAMNLLYKLKGYPLAYPKFKVVMDSNSVKPAVLVVGDSYYSDLFASYLNKEVVGPGQFWFYNRQVYSTESDEVTELNTSEALKEVRRQDVIFIISTEANLNRLGFGFIESMYQAYYGADIIDTSSR